MASSQEAVTERMDWSPASEEEHRAATVIQSVARGVNNRKKQRRWPGMDELKALFLVRKTYRQTATCRQTFQSPYTRTYRLPMPAGRCGACCRC